MYACRHSARANIPTNEPIKFPVPTSALPEGVFTASVKYYARSSPPGLTVSTAVSGVAVPGTAATLGVSWQEVLSTVTVNGSSAVGARQTMLQIIATSPFATGGKVWIDDLSLKCDKGNATHPCPVLQ